jgi:hypothetical protein
MLSPASAVLLLEARTSSTGRAILPELAALSNPVPPDTT